MKVKSDQATHFVKIPETCQISLFVAEFLQLFSFSKLYQGVCLGFVLKTLNILQFK